MNERDMARLRTMCQVMLGEVQVLQRMVCRQGRRLANGAIVFGRARVGYFSCLQQALPRARPMRPRHDGSGRLWGWHNGSYLLVRDEPAAQHDGGHGKIQVPITSCGFAGLDGRLSRDAVEDVPLAESVYVECQTRGISRSFTRIGFLCLRRPGSLRAPAPDRYPLCKLRAVEGDSQAATSKPASTRRLRG
ncbi:hypothetical protein CCMA1212_004457 [Trichoderma ghanense]|uniref:Uncharacterized protein n=1 Tax=Trichoderma ghanense TaxID=65468 RepID=A0ABY2H832_9HYPO